MKELQNNYKWRNFDCKANSEEGNTSVAVIPERSEEAEAWLGSCRIERMKNKRSKDQDQDLVCPRSGEEEGELWNPPLPRTTAMPNLALARYAAGEVARLAEETLANPDFGIYFF